MAETKHSPEPWELVRLEGGEDYAAAAAYAAYQARCTEKGSGPFFLVICEKPDGLADVAHTGNGPTSYANGLLIAAAPELLEAAAGLLELIGHGEGGSFKPDVAGTYNERVEALFAAIAKAEGRSDG